LFLPLGPENGPTDLVSTDTRVVSQKLVFLFVLRNDVDRLLDTVERLFQVLYLKIKKVPSPLPSSTTFDRFSL
jgi:hypothetical protein